MIKYATCKSCKHFDEACGVCVSYMKIITTAINLPHHCLRYFDKSE